MTGRYIGIGVSTYEARDQYGELPMAAADVKSMADVLTERGLDVKIVTDPTDAEYRSTYRILVGDPKRLIVYWSGHARQIPEGLGLVLRDTPGDTKTMFTMANPKELLSQALDSGAEQVLIVIDTCWSGAALGDLAMLAGQFEAAATRPDGSRIWVGIVAASQSYEKAVGGRLCGHLVDLLNNGPTTLELRRIWSAHNEGLRGIDLVRVMNDEWPSTLRQQIWTVQYGSSSEALLANAKYAPTAPERLVAELLDPAGRGAAPGESGWYFTGRRSLLEYLVQWVEAATTGLFVITGPPGSGKSAVLGRLRALSDPARRAAIPVGSLPGDGEPDLVDRRVDVVLHARNQDLAALRTAVATQLGVVDVTNKYAIMERLDRPDNPAIVLIDGLDEVHAGSLSAVVRELVLPLAGIAQVLVGTRDGVLDDGRALVAALREHGTVRNLDDEPHSAADLADYVTSRLADTANHENRQIVEEVGRRAAREGGFLYARMITTQLRAEPVDTRVAGWEARIAGSVAEALSAELSKLTGRSESSKALLTALAWSFGSGLPPHKIWPALAAAVAGSADDLPDADVDQALLAFRSYILESGEDGFAVYRLFHQEVVSFLAGEPSAGLLVDRAVVQLLAEQSNQGADPSRVDPYLERYAERHAARGGAETVAILRDLAAGNPEEYRPKLASALHLWSLYLAAQSDPAAALAAAEQATDLRRDLAVAYPNVYIGDLNISLGHDMDLRAALQDDAAAERRFASVVEVLPSPGDRARLYLWRSRGGTRRTWGQRLSDAADALDRCTGESPVQGQIRSQLVALHSEDPYGFETWWLRRYDDLPAWLAGIRLREVLQEWMRMPTDAHSRAFAVEHPEIGTPHAIELLDRLLSTPPVDPFDPHPKLIRWIAEHGVDWAYRRSELEVTVQYWLDQAPDWPQSQEYVRRNRRDLVAPEADNVLTSLEGVSPYVEIHRQLLMLIRHNETIRGYLMLGGDREEALLGIEDCDSEVQAAVTYLDGL